MKIHIVTSGTYSDYSIEAAFSSEALAQEYIAKASAQERKPDFNEIETWEVDGLKEAELFYVACIGMLLDDGSVVEQTERTRQKFGIKFRSRVTQCGARVLCYESRPIVRVESSVSKPHALKVAAEARQEWLRKKEVVTKDGK